MPLPVGPTTITAPKGWATARVRASAAASLMPSSSSEIAAAPEFMIRSVTFSPCVVGSTATRRSTERAPARSESRPSCGARFSAMSSSAITFRRLVTAGCRFFVIVASSRMTPSTRARTSRRLRWGVKWTSEAPRSIARLRTAFDLLIAGAFAAASRRSMTVAAGSSSTTALVVEVELAGVDPGDRAVDRFGGGDADAGPASPSAILRSSAATTFVGSLTATRTAPSSRKRTGIAQ